uniref:Uncharacterized protein n=1 Tax=Tetraselmis chuii TaxID=63592 RepID=A0A7S1T133_9CHLO
MRMCIGSTPADQVSKSKTFLRHFTKKLDSVRRSAAPSPSVTSNACLFALIWGIFRLAICLLPCSTFHSSSGITFNAIEAVPSPPSTFLLFPGILFLRVFRD